MDQRLLNIIQTYFATQPVLRVWLFGSYSRGEQTEDSDIDLLVDFDHEHASIGLLEYVRMMNNLSELLNRKVDMVENGALLPFAAKTADHDKKLIYEIIA